jgi:uroporphyrinogen-III synthase
VNDTQPLLGCLHQQQLAAITVTSVEALDNLLAMVDASSARQLCRLPMVVMSRRIADKAREMGCENCVASHQPSDVALLETLMTLLNGETSGRTN